MDNRTINRITAVGVFLVALATYIRTLPSTVVFWDVGEFMAAARLLQVPHPPGAPLFLLIARLFSMVPFANDIAVRMHFISTLASAMSVMFLYLISVRFISMFRGNPGTMYDRIVVYGGSVIGALSLTFSKTFWFNAVEAEVYGPSMLFVSAILWLALRWYERGHGPRSDAYLLFIAYLIGLAVGVHLLAILALFSVMLLVYFRNYEFTMQSFVRFGVVAVIVFGVVYPGIVKELPSLLDGEFGDKKFALLSYVPLIVIGAAVYGVYYSIREKKRVLNIALLSFLLIVLGYSTYIGVFIRAQAEPPMNENNPSTLGRLVSYLNREQYGTAPLIQRRWNQTDPEQTEAHKKYTSDLDYFWRYQLNEMYLRYFGWNFVGVAGDYKGAPAKMTLFGIPLLLGLFGAYYHWSRDKKMAMVATSMFLVLGLALVIYFNMQEPQPRERDYFYVGSFFIFALWIGIGAVGVADWLREKIQDQKIGEYASYAALGLALIFSPLNMLRVNFESADRSGNYLPWDYSYNLLQSCDKDAILFTNGDNDTFPLWYLQDVEGIRRDIRVVNLSLLNTDWYMKQLKNDEPYGAKKVPISRTNAQIDAMQMVQYEPTTVQIPVPEAVLARYDVKDTSIVNHKAIAFYMPNTVQFGNVKALRIQDLMVFDIVYTSKWERPIYFAMTVSDDGKIGLREFLRMEGLAFRLVPQRAQVYWQNLDVERMHDQLFTDVETYSREPQRGFLWRGLQDSTVYFDDDSRRLMMNYRQTFLALGYYYAYKLNQPGEFGKVLDRMEELMPRRIVKLPAALKFDLASFYRNAGMEDRAQELLREVVDELRPVIESGAVQQMSQDNPYLVLLQAYEILKMYPEAIDILDRIQRVYATEPGVDDFVSNRRAYFQSMMQRSGQADSSAAADTARP